MSLLHTKRLTSSFGAKSLKTLYIWIALTWFIEIQVFHPKIASNPGISFFIRKVCIHSFILTCEEKRHLCQQWWGRISLTAANWNHFILIKLYTSLKRNIDRDISQYLLGVSRNKKYYNIALRLVAFASLHTNCSCCLFSFETVHIAVKSQSYSAAWPICYMIEI